LFDEQRASYDLGYPASYYEAEQMFRIKFGITYDDARNDGKRDYFAQEDCI
jgi:hypothetical protein